MAPPQLARNAPGFDVAQPFEVDLLVGLRLEDGGAVLDRLQGGLGHDLGVDVPLIRHPRLDDHARAVAVRDHVLGLLDLAQPALFLGAGDDGLARGEAIHALVFSGHVGRIGGGDPAEGVHDVQRFKSRTLSDAEVIDIMGRRDLDRARPLGRIGIVVSHDRNAAAGDRQGHELADQTRIAFVFRVNGHAGVAQHGLGPGRGDDDEVARFELGRLAGIIKGDRMLIGHAVGQRIGEVPIGAVDLLLLDLKVADGGLEMRIPVHQTLVTIDQAVLVQLHEDLPNGGVQPLVQGEAFARPVAGRAQAAQLTHDGPAGFSLPLPHLLDEGVAAHVAAADVALGGQLALDDHLGGDARVVGARQPQDGLALHAVIAGQDVLKRVVQGVADVQAARYVRRRNDDRIGVGGAVSGLGRARGEQAAVLPLGVDARFGGLGFERLLKHGHLVSPRRRESAADRGWNSSVKQRAVPPEPPLDDLMIAASHG